MEGTCYIIGAGDSTRQQLQAIRLTAADLLITADGGYDSAVAAGLVPQLMIGDFDSIASDPAQAAIGEKIVLPTEKDDTDMMAAVRVGLTRGYRHFELYGVLGGRRMEHSLGNLMTGMYLKNQGCSVCLHGVRQDFHLIAGGETFTLPPDLEPGTYVSVLSLQDESTGITISGLKYTVRDFTMTNDLVTGLSNEVVAGQQGMITLQKGILVIIYEP